MVHSVVSQYVCYMFPAKNYSDACESVTVTQKTLLVFFLNTLYIGQGGVSVRICWCFTREKQKIYSRDVGAVLQDSRSCVGKRKYRTCGILNDLGGQQESESSDFVGFSAKLCSGSISHLSPDCRYGLFHNTTQNNEQCECRRRSKIEKNCKLFDLT